MRTAESFNLMDLVREQSEIKGSGEGRRFLKQLDRRLLRFSSQIDSFEERANRHSDDDEADLILEVEALHRETQLLREEIREHLAGGHRSLPEMMEYAEESWEQLRDTFAEVKENLEPEMQTSKVSGPRESAGEEDEDQEWTWGEDEWEETSERGVASEVHPPRVGPKR